MVHGGISQDPYFSIFTHISKGDTVHPCFQLHKHFNMGVLIQVERELFMNAELSFVQSIG